MSSNNDFWQQFSFSETKQKSALDYLSEFKDGLASQTSNELRIEIEAVDSYVDAEIPRLAIIYIFYVVAPDLGSFRKKILTVAEFSDTGHFPVEIINHFANNHKEESSEAEFKTKIGNILKSISVKTSIENLYQLSREQKQKPNYWNNL